jgi:hypothetical protein
MWDSMHIPAITEIAILPSTNMRKLVVEVPLVDLIVMRAGETREGFMYIPERVKSITLRIVLRTMR